MINAEKAKLLVQDELQYIYSQLQHGMDVSPGRRLRLEGKIELLLQWQLLDWPWLQDVVNQQYACFFGQPLADDYWLWMRQEQQFMLPAKMQDAPVFKS